jgi:hypothetical protein
VAVPETSVHKDNGMETREHHIRASGKVTAMQPEAETTAVQAGA